MLAAVCKRQGMIVVWADSGQWDFMVPGFCFLVAVVVGGFNGESLQFMC